MWMVALLLMVSGGAVLMVFKSSTIVWFGKKFCDLAVEALKVGKCYLKKGGCNESSPLHKKFRLKYILFK